MQKQINFDNTRLRDLYAIKSQIEIYFSKSGKLPKNLASINDKTNNTDPVNKMEYGYEIISDLKYKLCSDFYTDNTSEENSVYNISSYYTSDRQHKKGYDCLEYEVPSYNLKRTPTPTKNPRVTQKPKLIGEWKFDSEDSDMAFDTSGNGLNGRISTATYQNGKVGKALYFDGKSFVDIPENNILSNLSLGDFTVMLWVNNQGSGSQLVSTTNSNDGGFALMFGARGEVYCRTSNGLNYTDSYTDFTGEYLLSKSGWHHLAIVKSGSNCNVYVDAVRRTATFANHYYAAVSENSLTIGGKPNHREEMFTGLVDEVRLYNYALTGEEIKSVYQTVSSN